jgi:ribosomal protein L34
LANGGNSSSLRLQFGLLDELDPIGAFVFQMRPADGALGLQPAKRTANNAISFLVREATDGGRRLVCIWIQPMWV